MHGMTAVLHAVTSMGKSLMKAPVPIRCSVLDLPNEKSPPITTADGVLDRLVIQCFPAKSHNEKHLVFLNAALRGAFQPKEGNAMPRSATETGEGTEEVTYAVRGSRGRARYALGRRGRTRGNHGRRRPVAICSVLTSQTMVVKSETRSSPNRTGKLPRSYSYLLDHH
ncbi:hypothetical protein CPB85DRAFT_178063 [Mucidula mucida]|nr:hypothetical protein CPB85DRAFT_178063 [Mucidula mucida]